MPGLVPGIRVLLLADQGRGWAGRASPFPAINRRHRELRKLDAVDAAHIQRHHFGAVGLCTAREHVDAAIEAELMPDRVPVEQVFPQIFPAGAELKALRREEGEMQPLLGADRAVAGGHHRHIGGAFEAHLAAMAAAGVDLAVRHRSPLTRSLTRLPAPDDSARARRSQHSPAAPRSARAPRYAREWRTARRTRAPSRGPTT